MIIDNKKYNFVSEKTVNGKTCTLLRSDDNPKELVVLCEGKITPIKKEDWKK